MTAPNSSRTKCQQARRPLYGNPSPFAYAFGYSKFVMATGFSIDRHSRKLFGLKSGVKMELELIRHHPHAIEHSSYFKIPNRRPKNVGFFMHVVLTLTGWG